MVIKFLLGCLLFAGVPAPHPKLPPPSRPNSSNWAFLVAGSNTWDNYRHQADLCHAYQLLVSKGFSRDRIITMAYDDIAGHPNNPFPGKLFNSPDPTGLGVDVYDGCVIDYKGQDVTPDNFVNLLLGKAVTGGNGRTLNTTADDDLFIYYVDHGAPGLIQFPDGNVLHAKKLQETLQRMHARHRYHRMIIYIEACQSGSMLEGLHENIKVYGVTATASENPSMGTYCGWDSVINGTMVGTCLGDLFSVYWLKFVLNSEQSHTMLEMFDSVYDDVASYAAMHYGHEYNQQYGDISMAQLLVADFFHGESQSELKSEPQFSPPWHPPASVFAAPRLSADRRSNEYTEASARPLFHRTHRWEQMQAATQNLQGLLQEQKDTQQLHWDLVSLAFPSNPDQQLAAWTTAVKPANPDCETNLHKALVHFCTDTVDISTAYALQFHQVVVNLCSDETLGWYAEPTAGYVAAARACRKMATSRMSWKSWMSSMVWDSWSAAGDTKAFIV